MINETVIELADVQTKDKTVGRKRGKNSSTKKEFRLTAKSFSLTYPRCDIPKEVALLQLKDLIPQPAYICVALETHEDGGLHLHGLVTFAKKIEKKGNPALKFFDLFNDKNEVFHGNYQGTRDTDSWLAYIKKQDKFPAEFGEYESNNQSVLQKRALFNLKIITNPLTKLVLDGTINMMNYSNIRKAKYEFELERSNKESPLICPKICLWIQGEAGQGKSLWVREIFSNIFNKPQNKWFDGINPEDEVMLMDDFDHQGACLSHHLKIWSDDYKHSVELKGATASHGFKFVIITSNYNYEQLFTDKEGKMDRDLVSAIDRRFLLCHIEMRSGQRECIYDGRFLHEHIKNDMFKDKVGDIINPWSLYYAKLKQWQSLDSKRGLDAKEAAKLEHNII